MAIGYSREEMDRMQSDAIRRVRDMQQRSQSALRPEPAGTGRPSGSPGQGLRPGRPPEPGRHPEPGRRPTSHSPKEKPPSKGFNLLNMLNLKSLQFSSDTMLILMVFLILSSEESDELLLLALLYIIL